MTKYTDQAVNVSNTAVGAFEHGPYLRKVPPMPVGAHRGLVLIGASDGDKVGWIYHAATGEIRANVASTEVDSSGKAYAKY